MSESILTSYESCKRQGGRKDNPVVQQGVALGGLLWLDQEDAKHVMAELNNLEDNIKLRAFGPMCRRPNEEDFENQKVFQKQVLINEYWPKPTNLT
ncbi:hypothetical protein A3715_31105 [Oleiphilus sp. HI0009]|nr:hypothetical protein A3715_18250 [Oleiphilus sp. HI0009]KZX83814.1 hypothetical protein A3715_31105 [Oleiphilus sp. HI0009]